MKHFPVTDLFHMSNRALIVALTVGTILTIINHFDLFSGSPFTGKTIIQIILTYIVPYFVSLHGQISTLNN